ncbi:ABC transporter permease [Luteimicrobium album]|uniref:ABC transporter permease n=1 Tax=Luteimicrobium album TaxID=1054550 RepID=A0ABQ6I1A8_9MICO|nr:ABC transporter permease [Luteimicrobium album]GMA24440.1 ABC transporter permease [Luteimicrobium album]
MVLDETAGTVRRTHRLRNADPLLVLAVLVLAVIAVFVVAPGAVSPHDPLSAVGQSLQPPSGRFLFGTDYLGRDIFSRVVYGTRTTLLGSLVAVTCGLVVGSVLGLVAAYFGGVVDVVVGRLVDVLLSIPGLLLSMVIVVALGFGTLNAAVAVGASSVALFARLMRSEVLTVRELGFVESSRHIGASTTRILLRHILPNSYSSVLSLVVLQFGASILWISSLSFLGYGAPPPQPEWGLLIAEGRDYIVSSPWLVVLPGAVIVAMVLSITKVSRTVRRRYES